MSRRLISRLAASSSGTRSAGAARLLLATAFLPGILMPLAGCGLGARKASDGAAPANVPTKTREQSPIAREQSLMVCT